MGYRLPLDGLIDDEAGAFEAQIERSPLEERGRLPDFHAGVRARRERRLTEQSTRDDHPPRTALCVEARAGGLFVFLPPVSHLEHYLDLVAAVEVAAEALKLPVSLEGYPPPEDPRLRRFLLEPDAGVLRLDLPQTDNWDQLQGALSAAYEEAWALGLGTERVSADDGRRLPSGGGGRLTIGGVSPSDSPFLTRPEILRSLVAYWQRHPSLSYLFAGRLIGPSGSAPRPDEGRDEMLYELSIALERLPSGTSDKPWLPDRAAAASPDRSGGQREASGDSRRSALRSGTREPAARTRHDQRVRERARSAPRGPAGAARPRLDRPLRAPSGQRRAPPLGPGAA